MAVESVESLCQKARQAIGQGSIEQARQFYLQALGLRSDSPDVHYGLATVCYLLNDLDSAAYHFKEVTRLDPLRAGAYINLGAVYNRLEEYDEAIIILRQGIQIDPHRAEGYYNLGLVYRRRGQVNLAIQAYLEATRINPRMVDAHYNLANVYLELERYNLAMKHYREVLQLRPKWEKAVNGLLTAKEALKSQIASGEISPVAEKPAAPLPVDLHRNLDPQADGVVLKHLHQATAESENQEHQLMQVLEKEIEPVIKELSACLLASDQAGNKLDHCVERFEAAIQHMQTAQRVLENNLDRVKNLGNRLVQNQNHPAGVAKQL